MVEKVLIAGEEHCRPYFVLREVHWYFEGEGEGDEQAFVLEGAGIEVRGLRRKIRRGAGLAPARTVGRTDGDVSTED